MNTYCENVIIIIIKCNDAGVRATFIHMYK